MCLMKSEVARQLSNLKGNGLLKTMETMCSKL